MSETISGTIDYKGLTYRVVVINCHAALVNSPNERIASVYESRKLGWRVKSYLTGKTWKAKSIDHGIMKAVSKLHGERNQTDWKQRIAAILTSQD